jgi:hypothetical protein
LSDESDLEAKLIRRQAAMAYNSAFDAIEAGGDPLLILELASASLHLWRQVGTVKNFAIGYWMLSRALVLANCPELALKSAEESLELLKELKEVEDPQDFLIASIHEGWARALISAKDPRAAQALRETAELIGSISDPKEREIIYSQFADIADYS